MCLLLQYYINNSEEQVGEMSIEQEVSRDGQYRKARTARFGVGGIAALLYIRVNS